MSEAPQIYHLNVRLLGISPMIWRRVRVLDSTTLHDVHGSVAVAMGWESIHLYAFEIDAVQYGALAWHVASPDITLRDFWLRARDRFRTLSSLHLLLLSAGRPAAFAIYQPAHRVGRS